MLKLRVYTIYISDCCLDLFINVIRQSLLCDDNSWKAFLKNFIFNTTTAEAANSFMKIPKFFLKKCVYVIFRRLLNSIIL